MSELSKNLRRTLVGYSSRLLAFALSSLGIITSSCGVEPVAYGPAYYSLSVYGKTMSSEDSTTVPDITVGAFNADSSTVFDSTESGNFGTYTLYIDTGQYSWPDTVRIVAVDTDGDQNGTFMNSEVMVFPDGTGGSQEINVDLYLQPDTTEQRD